MSPGVVAPASPLGVFDSGIGGLTVARAVFERLPEESVIYFGDTARVPYGPKSPDTVRRYSAEILAYLLKRGVKAVVVACNTSTAHALADLQQRSPVPVVGVIEPGARAAVRATRTGKIGVIGTAGTIASGAYERAIRALKPDAVVHQQACPLFVPLVEEGETDSQIARLVAEQYLAPLREKRIDTLVLGCTHYPLLKSVIKSTIGAPNGESVALVDSAEATAEETAQLLERHGLLNHPLMPTAESTNAGASRFYVTDAAGRFHRIAERILEEPLDHLEAVEVWGNDKLKPE